MMQIVERKNKNFTIDGISDDKVRSRNFKGLEKKDQISGRTVNSPGRRNFLLFLTPEIAQELSDNGVEVKYTKPQNPNDEPSPYVSINVSWYVKPVEVCMISNGNPTMLDENHVGVLDDVDIGNMCMELQYGKEKTHLNGVKYIPLYAQKIWVEIVPSYIASKFGTMNMAQINAPSVPSPVPEPDDEVDEAIPF